MTNEIEKIENDEIIELQKNVLEQKLNCLLQHQQVIKSLLVENLHYMRIPGSEKPCLLKAGAELLAEVYGFYPEFEILDRQENWNTGFFFYFFKCSLYSKKTQQKVSEGFGSYNSLRRMTKKKIFVFENELRSEEKEKIQELRVREGISKSGKPFKMYEVERAEVFTDANSILKMAEKSAFIDAVLKATRSSGIFTQDLEDMKETVKDEREELIAQAFELFNQTGPHYWRLWKEERKIKAKKVNELNNDELRDLISFLIEKKQINSEETKEE